MKMKRQIRISKFFASKQGKFSKHAKVESKESDVIIVDEGDEDRQPVCAQKEDFQAKKRRLGTKQNDEVESQVRKRVKCEEGEGVEHNGSSEPQRSNTVHLSEKTKLKLSSFSLDSGEDRHELKPSSITVDDLKRSRSELSTNGDIDDVTGGKSQDEEEEPVRSSDEEPGPSCSESAVMSSQFSKPITKTQSDVLGKFTAVRTKSADVYGNTGKANRKSKCKYTPLEQQFVTIKDKCPDAVLFVECGYKYRFFGEDAEIAAKVLKIFCHPDHNFMTASIPTHRLFVHVRRLVAAGYKVGVVKQTETAALKAAGENKGAPFTRELTALYTKSTLIGEDVDPLSGQTVGTCLGDGASSRPNAHLMCVFENLPTTSLCSPSKPQTIAIMSVQPSTGELVYDCFEDGVTRSQLETRILHLEPVELLLPQTLTERTESLITDIVSLSNTDDDRIRMERLEDSVFEHGKAFETIMDFYSENEKGSEVLQDVITLPRQTLSCLAALITYLREFNLHRVLRSLSSITRFTTKHKYMDLGGNTVKNLELFSNLTDGGEQGSLFWIMNHTVTKFGSRLLRTWVRQPLLDTSEIKARQDAVEELLHGSCPELCQLQAILKQLPDLEKGLCTIFHKKCSPAEFCLVVRALHRVHRAVTQLLDTAGAELRSKLLKQSLGQIPDLLSDVSSYSEAISDQAARENDKTKLFIDEIQFPAIVERKLEIEKVLSELKGHRREVRLTLKQPTLEFVTIMGTEFLVEVRNAHLKLVPSDWLKINSTKAMSRFHTPFIEKKYKELNQLREKLLIDCTQAWMTFLDSFGENYQRYKRAIHHLAVLDCLFSLVNVANHGNCCRPDIVEDSVEIRIDQGRHPVVDQLLGGQDQYVPNDTALKGDAQRVMIITGPNMGGKSSYIRQVALIVIMAQIGSYVPAEFARLGVFDAVFTRMGARDDLYRGRSTFMVELQEASAIMAQATHKSLVILDELGRGTSTHDGVAIAHATLAHFITQVKCLTLFVTHYPSLAEFEKIYPEHVNNFHMSFMLLDEIGDESDYAADNAITFLYQVVRGKAARSYGLNVARLADIPHDILKLAACKSQELEEIIAGKREALDVFCRIFSSRTLRTESSSPSADSMNLG